MGSCSPRPLDHALARLAFENSFIIRESLPAGEKQEFAREAKACGWGLWLVPEERLPVRLGRTKLDYDGGALGALTEKGAMRLKFNVLHEPWIPMANGERHSSVGAGKTPRRCRASCAPRRWKPAPSIA